MIYFLINKYHIFYHLWSFEFDG